eukprot:g5916.t1
MASLVNPKRGDAHDKLKILLQCPDATVLERMVTAFFEKGKIDIEFIKTLQLHIDICVQRKDMKTCSQLMTIYQLIESKAKPSKEKATAPPTKDEVRLDKAKNQLAVLFKCKDATELSTKLRVLLKTGDVDFKIFEKLLEINLDVATKKNYTTKRKFIVVIQNSIKEYRSQQERAVGESRQLHAPSFTFHGQENDASGEKSNAIVAEAIDLIVNLKGLNDMLLGRTAPGGGKRRGKKKKKVGGNKNVEKLAKQLVDNGYAICDNFLSADTCTEIRQEAISLEPYFEKSEIWVGKSNEVGAHVTVPSVRGDKVLWMCGGHKNQNTQQFDSAGVQPQTRGDVAPCKPALQALAMKGELPLSKFLALKSTMKAIDKLVFEKLSRKVPYLNGISERSDCMLANYNEGGRFQRHVDNTTRDGRKLTVLCYLNPEKWKESDGGHLRIHPSTKDPVDIAPEGGRLALFFSDQIEHEVRPCYGERFSFTMWYFDFNERMGALKQASDLAEKTALGNDEMAKDVDSHAAAKDFISLMFGDLATDETGKSYSLEDQIEVVKEKGKSLSSVALKIVGGVLGVDKDRVLPAVNDLDTKSYAALRHSFSKMGV